MILIDCDYCLQYFAALSVVDTSEAGTGDVDVTVTCSSGHVMVKRQKIDEFRQIFTFVPSLPTTHDVNVTFNKQQVVGISGNIRLFNVDNSTSDRTL